MNTAAADRIAKAVLYEGYMLYPYRPSSVKNQQRFNFGVVYPQPFSEVRNGSDPWIMQTECLVQEKRRRATGSASSVPAAGGTVGRSRQRPGLTQTWASPRVSSGHEPLLLMGRHIYSWQEAVEREIDIPATDLDAISCRSVLRPFQLPGECRRRRAARHRRANCRDGSCEHSIPSMALLKCEPSRSPTRCSRSE